MKEKRWSVTSVSHDCLWKKLFFRPQQSLSTDSSTKGDRFVGSGSNMRIHLVRQGDDSLGPTENNFQSISCRFKRFCHIFRNKIGPEMKQECDQRWNSVFFSHPRQNWFRLTTHSEFFPVWRLFYTGEECVLRFFFSQSWGFAVATLTEKEKAESTVNATTIPVAATWRALPFCRTPWSRSPWCRRPSAAAAWSLGKTCNSPAKQRIREIAS